MPVAAELAGKLEPAALLAVDLDAQGVPDVGGGQAVAARRRPGDSRRGRAAVGRALPLGRLSWSATQAARLRAGI